MNRDEILAGAAAHRTFFTVPKNSRFPVEILVLGQREAFAHFDCVVIDAGSLKPLKPRIKLKVPTSRIYKTYESAMMHCRRVVH